MDIIDLYYRYISYGGVSIFKLKSDSGNNRFVRSVATKEEIERQTLIGKTHIEYEGASYFIYIEDEGEREEFKNNRGIPHYEWFRERTGNKNWVLYNPLQFKQDLSLSGKKILKFNSKNYMGGKIELPINASSCCGMFSWLTIPDDFTFGRMFNTKNIVDMNLMFAGSVLPKDFQLGKYFDTSNVEDMNYMFYECSLPYGFTFGENFRTSKVKNMEYMFSECKMPKNTRFPETFSTESVNNMGHMFYGCIFNEDFEFNKSFVIKDNVNIDHIFYDCYIGEEQINNWYAEDMEHVKELLSKE